MAIENTYLLGKNITLGCGFDLQAKAPLDSRQIVPLTVGLQALIDGNAAYEGMIVYDEESKKTYQAQIVDGVLAFREFGLTEAELKELIAAETTAAMEFKGIATAIPENPSKGDFYKVTSSFEVAGETAKVGDSIVYDGTQWFIIPSGDDIEDTWRPVTDVGNDATLTFAAGDKLDVAVATDGTITYKHEAVDTPTATPVGEGEQTRTYITSVETDGFGHITGYKTATENVEDTNTEYTFEGQSEDATSVYFQVTSNEEGATAEVVYLNAYSKNEVDAELAKKLDKSVYEAYIAGKAMSDEELKTYAKDYADGLAGNYAAAEHDHVVADITDFETVVATKVESYGYATTDYADQAEADAKAYTDTEVGKDRARLDALEAIDHDAYKGYADGLNTAMDTRVKALEEIDHEAYKGYADQAETDAIASAKSYTDTEIAKDRARLDTLEGIDHDAYKSADATLKSELQGEIDADVKVVSDALAEYKTSNDAAVALKANSADVYTKSEVEALLAWGTF